MSYFFSNKFLYAGLKINEMSKYIKIYNDITYSEIL